MLFCYSKKIYFYDFFVYNAQISILILETLHHCPVCGYTQHQHFLTCQDFTITQEKFELVKCQNCDFCFTNPRPNAEEIHKYYQSEKYISHSNTKKGLFSFLYQNIRKKALSEKIHFIADLTKNIPKNRDEKAINVLDYGCGTGEFLQACQQKTWHIAGIEPSPEARTQAERLNNIEVFEDIFSFATQNSEKTFEIITLWHVLEHIHLLGDTLEKLYQLLADDGFLLVAVPNHASQEAGYYKEYWAGYDVPRHLYHFTPNTMDRLMKTKGFEVVQQFPMPYDAYYISLLSGQYKNGYKNYIDATFRGYFSNQHAQKHEGNYSSVLYVIKKRA